MDAGPTSVGAPPGKIACGAIHRLIDKNFPNAARTQ
jgi:hypothetical protein